MIFREFPSHLFPVVDRPPEFVVTNLVYLEMGVSIKRDFIWKRHWLFGVPIRQMREIGKQGPSLSFGPFMSASPGTLTFFFSLFARLGL